MKRALLFMLPMVLGLSACLKDDLDPAALTTNPLDPDYTGPALIELVSDTTRIVYQGGMPTDTVVEQTVQVRTDLLPPGTDWKLYVTLVNTGEVFDYGSELPTPEERPYHHVVPGTSYCFDYQLKVQFSLTKAWRYCTVAEP
ncbi:MAG TPA: hypothetical protein PKD45_07965 [Flavobacteriales bacterium]|nr:hypothetical protein [Flavobacteriales bacterium]